MDLCLFFLFGTCQTNTNIITKKCTIHCSLHLTLATFQPCYRCCSNFITWANSQFLSIHCVGTVIRTEVNLWTGISMTSFQHLAALRSEMPEIYVCESCKTSNALVKYTWTSVGLPGQTAWILELYRKCWFYKWDPQTSAHDKVIDVWLGFV